jgi:deoxycytidine triphosphate deaminase
MKIRPRPTQKQLQPISIDLRLGKVYTLRSSKSPLDPERDKPLYDKVKPNNGSYLLQPKRLYFFETQENLDLNNEIDEVYIAPRSSLARALVNIIGLSGEGYFVINPPFRGRVFCLLYSNSFPLTILQGERIVQMVAIKKVDRSVRTRQLHLESFLKPREDVSVNVENGVKDDQLFSPLQVQHVMLGEGDCLKGITSEVIDYSDGNTGAIIEYYGGETTAVYGPALLNTGYAPLIDPGFSGKVFGVLTGSPFEKLVRVGDVLLRVREYGISGRIKRLYGSKNLGSHYKKQSVTKI